MAAASTSSTAPASPSCAGGALTLLVVTLNEGALVVEPATIRNAARQALASACGRDSGVQQGVLGAVLARQEVCSANDEPWLAALASLGFTQCALRSRSESRIVEASASLELYLRNGVQCEVLVEPRVQRQGPQGPKGKGMVAAVVGLPGPVRLCLGSVHLDGNIDKTEERVSLLPLALSESTELAGGVDLALVAGDVNCTLEPRGCPESLSAFLASEMIAASQQPEKNAVLHLSPKVREAMATSFSTPELREFVQPADGCPQVLQPDVDQMSRGAFDFHLARMPPGSFPTYRLCASSEGALGALAQQCAVGDGVHVLSSSLQVEPKTIEKWYFESEDGKAGAIKKRGLMTRLQLGWLDRLYFGANSPWLQPAVSQGEPLLLEADGPEGVLDHLLVPWLVTLPPAAREAAVPPGK